MIPEIGLLALALALAMACAQAIVPMVGAYRGDAVWMHTARPLAVGQLLFLALSFVCLAAAFLGDNFSVQYVANNSNSALPWYYKITAVWGGHEGSMLLWVTVLGLWQCAVAVYSRSLPERFSARVLAVMAIIAVGFLLFVLFTSNPFARSFPAPVDGQDLNPLLQDPGLIIHPPMLYMGYVGFVVPFAFAVAALIGGRLDATWARWSRPWTAVGWIFLTLGIALGSWWAYYELGWGGWWFWDPVENASFMPWLVGTALLHSLAVTEKRGALKSWTVLLAIIAFSLSLLGTFLVRSGVLTSVHSFASDPARGVFILALLLLTIGVSLGLYAWRAPRLKESGQFDLFSRETALLINNALLTTAAATVLIGTLYPLAMDALGIGKISVGKPYFNSVFVPLMLPLVLLTGVGPLMRWKRQDRRELMRYLRLPLLAATAGGVVIMLAISEVPVMTAVGFAAAIWVVSAMAVELYSRVRNKGNKLQALARQPRGVWGMTIAHLGMAVFVAGVTAVSTFDVQRDVRMSPGDTASFGPYDVRFDGVQNVDGPNYSAVRGTLTVTRDGESVAVMNPERRRYRVQRSPMTEAAIDPGFTRDVFVALGESLEGNAWSVRLQYKPLIRWIWAGALIMAIGGGLAASDPRYRRLRERESQWAQRPATGGEASA